MPNGSAAKKRHRRAGHSISEQMRSTLRQLVDQHGERAAAAMLGLTRNTVIRAISGLTLHAGTHALLERAMEESSGVLNTRLATTSSSGLGGDSAMPQTTLPTMLRPAPVLRTDEDRELMAQAIWDAQCEQLGQLVPFNNPPPFLVASSLSLAAFMRRDYPEMDPDQAMAAAAKVVASYMERLMAANRPTRDG